MRGWQLGLVFLFLVSIFLRFYQFSSRLMFLGDQGRDVLVAYKILHGDLAFIGPMTSVGNFYLGPFYYYFITPWLFLFHYSPLGPGIAIAVASLVSLALFYYFVYLVTSSHLIAFGASFLYATNPIIVEYSRFSWNPNLLPLVSLFFIYLVYHFWQKEKEGYTIFQAFWLGLTYGIILQLHYLAGLIIFLPLILKWKFWLNLRKSYLSWLSLIGSVIFIQLPFILFEVKHNFREVYNLINSFGPRSSTHLLTFNPFLIIKNAIRLLLLFHFKFLFLFPLFLVLVLFLKRPISKIILLYLGMVLFSLSLYQGPLYDHYFAFAFWLPYFIFALSWFLVKEKRMFSFLFLFLVLAGGVYNLFLTYERVFKYPPNRQFKTVQQVSQLIQKESHNQPFNLALLSDNNYADGYKFFLFKSGAPLKTIHQQLTDQLFVVCEKPSSQCQPLNNPLWDIAAFGWAKIAKKYPLNWVTVYKLVHRPKE